MSVGWWPFPKVLLFIANNEVLKEKKDGNPNVSSCVAFFHMMGVQPLPPLFRTSLAVKKVLPPKKKSNQQKNEDPMGVLMTCLLFFPYNKPQKKLSPNKNLSFFCVKNSLPSSNLTWQREVHHFPNRKYIDSNGGFSSQRPVSLPDGIFWDHESFLQPSHPRLAFLWILPMA